MSHDIRTPMNAILGFTQLMKNQLEHPEVMKDYLKNVEESGEYLLSIINNVLDMARIESGKVELEESLMDLGDKSQSILDMFSSLVGKKNLTLHSCLNFTHRYIYVDVPKISQIMTNLLSNAIKYTPEGGVITMTTEEVPSDRPGYATYIYTVSDTGIGMDKEFLSHIFDPFSREKTSTESKVVGTGLGMAIVKNYIDLMGGSVQVESVQGKGTTFHASFTCRLAEVETPEETVRKEENLLDVDLKGRRVLLAEDNEINALIAVAILNDFGMEVETAEDGAICLEMLEKAADDYYDLVLMDVQMPHMEGYEATGRIRSLKNRRKAEIPIVALTANAFEEDRQDALKAGMNDHLAKPIEIPLLLCTLSNILR